MGSGRPTGTFKVHRFIAATIVLANRPGDFLVELLAGQHARRMHVVRDGSLFADANLPREFAEDEIRVGVCSLKMLVGDRKSTRLNSSHSQISYAVFCLKKKKESR